MATRVKIYFDPNVWFEQIDNRKISRIGQGAERERRATESISSCNLMNRLLFFGHTRLNLSWSTDFYDVFEPFDWHIICTLVVDLWGNRTNLKVFLLSYPEPL